MLSKFIFRGQQKVHHYKRRGVEAGETQNMITLSDIIKENILIFCWCNCCSHNDTIDPASLKNILGPLFPIPELGRRMRCSQCQARDIYTRPAWPNYGGGQIAKHN